MIDRDYPHQVCLDVPRIGFGARMNEITDFCRERDYAHRPGDDRFVHQAIWCFRSTGEADEFHARFSPIWTCLRIDR
ncbi:MULTISPECIES: hypothetical protein [Kaistia]|uniref:Uncharacterized protein n=1 Tax=Kaistia nematophila TaxID=2994654 RepID=A0A9X3E1B8_9HYPH|nr:hypothetical protein [Kaistia nematophila]MCX5569579.1 hypothetical protein [Kaistia nematophila]